MQVDKCALCPKRAEVGVSGYHKGILVHNSYCEPHWNFVKRGGLHMSTGKATHIRLKTGSKVSVERIQNVLVVRSMKGAVIGSYGSDDMQKFHQRYKTLTKTGNPSTTVK